MPTLLTREQALERIRGEVGRPSCLMCALRDRVTRVFELEDEGDVLVLCPRFVRMFGHIVVMPRPHCVTYGEVDAALWARVDARALHAARVVERVQNPRRVYLASTGSAAGELTQSSVHLHVHVLPIDDPNARPADVFSWSDGIWEQSDEELEAVRDAYRAEWARI